MKKNILLLGGTGFLGKNIVEKLIESNHRLILIVRDSKKALNFFNDESISLIEGDLSDLILIDKTIEEYDVNLVIHLISNLIPSSLEKDFNNELKDVITPTFKLLGLLSDKKIKVIYFSSGGTIYGASENIISENSILNPINYYGYSKLMIENYIFYLNRTKNLSFLILRPSNVYGKYQKLDSKQGFIAVALNKALSNETIEIWGDGNVVRDYIDVIDVSNGLNELINMDASDTILNIGTGKGSSLNDILSMIEKNLKIDLKINYKNKRKVDVNKVILNINKIKEVIGFTPKDLTIGLENFISIIKKTH